MWRFSELFLGMDFDCSILGNNCLVFEIEPSLIGEKRYYDGFFTTGGRNTSDYNSLGLVNFPIATV